MSSDIHIPDPRSSARYSRTSSSRGTNREMVGWVFMRVSGVVLIILVFGHLFTNLWLGDGIKAVDWGFVAGKWANPVWQIWDLLMLWLGLLHGGNGVRTIITDYARSTRVRHVLIVITFAAVALTIALGTLVIFQFDPCMPVPADQVDQLPSFCPAP